MKDMIGVFFIGATLGWIGGAIATSAATLWFWSRRKMKE